ncbi:amidohydrolase [Marinomonas sp. PE14-40]|uniref:amidohydrolase n=1 Tax=Marinomonas sp. PE14-40 TaxID=3060621 RepID=UPI003F676D1D
MSANLSPQSVRLSADIVLKNAHIYTVDPQQPWSQAVAIKNGTFLAVGNDQDMQAHIDEYTQVIDLEGQFIMPGIYDMHTHPDLALAPSYAGYLDIAIPDPTPEQVERAILDYATQNPDKEWVYGSYFVRYTFKQAGIVADRHWLDSIISDRPVAILDRSWGCMLVNSKALELAGITADTLDPKHGYIERDSLTGEANGILVDGAYAMIHAAMPPTPQHALERAYREGLHYQSSRGVVGTKYVHVCEHRLNALRAIDQKGKLSARIEAAISWQDDIFPVKRRWELLAGERHFYRSNRLNANAVKFHFDGTHESKSSYLSTPWPGESEWRGHLNLTPEHIKDMVVDMDRKNIRVIAHCTGDGASDIFLDAVAAAREANPNGKISHQCAHSTSLLDKNLPRFKSLNVTAEFSPVGWFPSSFANARSVFGEERMQRAYNFKGVLGEGGNAVMGTDWPVSSLNPWIGFEAMITRQNPRTDDNETFYGQGIELDEAIKVMTINGAKSMNIDNIAGNICAGKSADLILLDRNPFSSPARGNLHGTNVLLTLIEGQVSWDSQGLFANTPLQAIWQAPAPNFDY